MNHLQEQYDFCTKKLAELQRQTDLRQGEIKDCLAKGQKDKAKLVLKRKKIIEKQMVAVQNVRAPCHRPDCTSSDMPRRAQTHWHGSPQAR